MAENKEMQKAADPAGPPVPQAAEAPRTIDYHMRKILDHVWGPTGSVILHIIVLIIVLNIVVAPSRKETSEIEVQMVEPDAKQLEKLEQKLEELKDVQVEVETPETQVDVNTPEVETFNNAPVADALAALDIKTDAMSPLIMKGLHAGRSASGRAGMLGRFNRKYGGQTEKAVMNALRWLKDHQLDDGSWEGTGTAKNGVAMTGIALLAFLAHGETHQSEEFGKTVKKAIDFLKAQQQGDGSFQSDRAFSSRNSSTGCYANGIALYAMSEAYALTRIPDLRSIMENGTTYVLNGMQDTGAYTYLYAKDGRRDTSVAGWQAQAVKAAYLAGADIPSLKEKMNTMVGGFKMNYDAASGMFRYAPGGKEGGDGTTLACTAIGTLCIQLLGFPSAEQVEGALRATADAKCNWNNPEGAGNHPIYAWYYLGQAKFQSKKKSDFENWNNSFAPEMIKSQNADGSWTPQGGSEKGYGPVYGTAFGALSLMVYYRFLPTYQEIKEEEKPKEGSKDDIVIEVGFMPEDDSRTMVDAGGSSGLTAG